MVKIDNKWGTVCDDNFTSINAQAACSTLGFKGGSMTKYDTSLSEASVSILMDEVKCSTKTDNFLQCTHAEKEDCNHDEDVLITCEAVCIEISSNCEDCKMCQDSDSGYQNSWKGDTVRSVFKVRVSFEIVLLNTLNHNSKLKTHA